jgi:beta-glucosidase
LSASRSSRRLLVTVELFQIRIFRFKSYDSFSKNGKIVVSVKVKNTGKVTGKEVVQLYIRDLIGSVTRPVKELKGFEMIELKANETKEIFSIDNKTIEFYTA